MSIAKVLYRNAMRAVRFGAEPFGVLAFLENRRSRRVALWLRSLFAIHDLDDMIHLDLPWWTFSAIDRVDEFLLQHPQAHVFEYGSGSSTIWLAKRAGVVESVEHSPDWTARMAPRIRRYSNIRLRAVAPSLSVNPRCASEKAGWQGLDFSDYVHAIDDTSTYDLIIVDGRARNDCLRAAIDRLSPGGLIVFDDSYRERYQTALRACDLARYDARGLSPGLPYASTTTLLAREPATLVKIGARGR